MCMFNTEGLGPTFIIIEGTEESIRLGEVVEAMFLVGWGLYVDVCVCESDENICEGRSWAAQS